MVVAWTLIKLASNRCHERERERERGGGGGGGRGHKKERREMLHIQVHIYLFTGACLLPVCLMSQPHAKRLSRMDLLTPGLVGQCQYSVNGPDNKFDLQLVSQCGST